MDLINQIKNQVGSNGEIGWPVAVRDRIAFPSAKELIVSDANVAVSFLWTMRDFVLDKLSKKNLAIATNFYTPAGLQGMVRNILGNPFIRYIIIFGEEYSSKAGDPSTLTSANAIRAFFREGVNSEGKLKGFESSVHFDKNIPREFINKIKEKVKLIDLNKEMPNASLEEKISKANELARTLEKLPAFLDKPLTFEYEKTNESFPYEGGAILVSGRNIPEAWIKMIYQINRYGRKNLMNANTDREIKEVNNMVVVIHDPQDMELSINPFLIPLTKEKIEAYQKEILSPNLPEGKAYTYGNKLRAYYYPSSEKINELMNKDYTFEFGKGDFLKSSINFSGEYCEINQIQEMIEVLKRDNYSKAALALTWHPADELLRKHKSSPCLVLVQAIISEGELNFTAYFRSHDMAQGWPENAYGCAAIQKEIAEAVGVETGTLTIISDSAQIYNNYYSQIEDMLKKYYGSVKFCSDRKGNYLISVDGQIVVKLVHPDTGEVLEEFRGNSEGELRENISRSANLETGHAMYLGKELLKAEKCLKENREYIQDS